MSERSGYTPPDAYKGDFDKSVLNHQFQQELRDIENMDRIKDDQIYELVSKDDPEYGTAIPISLKGDESEEDIARMIEEAAPYRYWWKQPQWKEKGNPLQIVTLSLKSGKEVETYNWLRELGIDEQEALKKVVGQYASLANGKALETLRYILISNTTINTKLTTGEDVNGAGTILPTYSSWNGIQLYPNSIVGEHRTGGISNFEGTLKHEIAHHLVQYLIREWTSRFGWKLEGDKYVCTEEGRCITEYAKTSPSEDICDSITAFLSNNDRLDPEKAEFLAEKLNSLEADDTVMDSQVLIGDDARLPHPDKIYYKKSGIVIHLE